MNSQNQLQIIYNSIVTEALTNITPEEKVLIVYEDYLQEEVEQLKQTILQYRSPQSITLQPTEVEQRLELMRNPQGKELDTFARKHIEAVQQCSYRLRLHDGVEPEELYTIPFDKITAFKQAVDSKCLKAMLGDKTTPGKKWSVIGIPSQTFADNLEIPLETLTDVLIQAHLVNRREQLALQQQIATYFTNAQKVHIKVQGKTDLTFSLEGRGPQFCPGTLNFPDGELFYGPVEDSLEGYITFPYFNRKEGFRVQNATVWFRNGEVTKVQADKYQESLEAFIELANKKVGEFGIGTNAGNSLITGIPFFDEKVAGTVHFAFGFSYTYPLYQGGGLHKAPVHWDHVCELREINGQPGGTLTVNDQIIQKNGNWLF